MKDGYEAVVGQDGLGRPAWAYADQALRDYYDSEWSVPMWGEQGMFELLALLLFQAGMRWRLILARRPQLRRLFCSFDVDRVAAFTDTDVRQILDESAGIRNEQKIRAVIALANAVQKMRAVGGLPKVAWQAYDPDRPRPMRGEEVPSYSARSAELAKRLTEFGCKRVGARTAYAFMQACGIVDDNVPGTWRADVLADEQGNYYQDGYSYLGITNDLGADSLPGVGGIPGGEGGLAGQEYPPDDGVYWMQPGMEDGYGNPDAS